MKTSQSILHHFFTEDLNVVTILEALARTWLGYILIINSGVGILTPLESLGLGEPGYSLLKAMWDTGFLMHLTKLLELVGGIMLVLNLYVPLALILLMPVLVTILGFGIFIFHGVRLSLPMMLIAIFLIFRNLQSYKPLFNLRAR